MKVGDKVGVDIGGHWVADAKVKRIDDDRVTLVVPATEVVMALKTTIDPSVGPDRASGTEHAILGSENVQGDIVADSVVANEVNEENVAAATTADANGNELQTVTPEKQQEAVSTDDPVNDEQPVKETDNG